ncbi:MAG: hypothetical protein OEU76_07110 [Cyclobacteriaceae bacterium]|nr:hypothetical protein [Cyclobacteriaceae bacterium]
MNYLEVYLVPYLISNLVALLILWAAWKKPTLARLLFALLFIWACAMNLFTALTNPSDYLAYANMAPDWYKDFIEGWFADHITVMVTLIAIGQGAIAIGMLLLKPWVQLACVGAILFLLGIAPLGVGSAFPFSITASAAAYLIFRKKELTYLWRSSW